MRWRICSTIVLMLITCRSFAQSSLAYSRNARTFETIHSSLVVKGLAHSCLAILVIPDSMPCNPAHTSLNKKSSFGGEILLANGYANLTKIRRLLDGEIDQSTIDEMFSKDKVTQLESNVDIQFQSKYLNGMYSPFSIKSFSVVRNEANPDIEFYAFEEKGFTFQSGMEVFRNFYAGLQARIIDRKFIRNRFKLLDLATTEGQNLLKPKSQSAIYVEPGLTYMLPMAWKPRFSFFLANAGHVSEEYNELKTPIDPQFGVGIAPPVLWGDLELSLEYRSMNYEEENAERLRLGALYSFGSMYLSGGLDANGVSTGVFYYLDQINSGVVYSTTRFLNSNDESYTQTVYVQIGWQL